MKGIIIVMLTAIFVINNAICQHSSILGVLKNIDEIKKDSLTNSELVDLAKAASEITHIIDSQLEQRINDRSVIQLIEEIENSYKKNLDEVLMGKLDKKLMRMSKTICLFPDDDLDSYLALLEPVKEVLEFDSTIQIQLRIAEKGSLLNDYYYYKSLFIQAKESFITEKKGRELFNDLSKINISSQKYRSTMDMYYLMGGLTRASTLFLMEKNKNDSLALKTLQINPLLRKELYMNLENKYADLGIEWDRLTRGEKNSANPNFRRESYSYLTLTKPIRININK